jgi:hypothetical protein
MEIDFSASSVFLIRQCYEKSHFNYVGGGHDGSADRMQGQLFSPEEGDGRTFQTGTPVYESGNKGT